MSSKRGKPSGASFPKADVLQPSAMTPLSIQMDSSESFRLRLHVKPGARLSRVTDLTDDFIGLQIAAPPRDGEANEEVVSYVASIFSLKERQVRLLAGHKSRDKVVLVTFESRTLSVSQIKEALLRNM